MKKLLFFVAAMMATTVMAKDVTLSELIIRPGTKEYNVFTSSLEDIAKAWESNITTKETETSCSYHGTTLSYANVSVAPIFLQKNGNERSVKTCLMFGSSNKAKSKKTSEKMISDLSALGIQMPAIQDGRSIKKDGLPQPFKSIVLIVTNEGIILKYSFIEGSTPAF